VAIHWEDWNLGSSATGSAFDDRIVVRNTAANLVLLDTSLAYDPQQIVDGQVLGAIQPGHSRQRSFTFRLPYGLKGTGEIGITVTTDQNAAGLDVLFETNLTNDAETNNSATTSTTAAAVPYADLRIDSLSASSTGVGGEPVTVSWTVANHGQADTAVDWNDQIVFSNDAIIGNADDVVIGTLRHSGGLAQGGSYAQSATIRIPVRPEGRYYLGIKTDTGTEVLEPDTRVDNVSSARAIDLAAAYADLNLISLSVPETAQSGETLLITWEVRNDGNATTDLALWNDRVVLSSDDTLGGDDIVLAGSVTHAGLLSPGQGYTGRATITLPRDLSGEYYVIVDTNNHHSVTELGRTSNNSRSSVAKLRVGLAPVPDLTVADVSGPTSLRPGETATVTYTVSNQGSAATTRAWSDRIYIDHGAQGLYELANLLNSDPLAAGASLSRSASFTLPFGFQEGDFRWVVKTDADDTLYERNGEVNNQAASTATVHVSRVDLAVTEVRGPGLVQSGSTLHLEWTVSNRGAAAPGNWVDAVYLVQGGMQRKFAEMVHAGGLAAGAGYTASANFELPLEYRGEYDILVITDVNRVLDDANRSDNQTAGHLSVDLAPYADLAVTQVEAPERIISDPAPLDVSWTVTNQGTGVGRSAAWADRVILSQDDTLGNGDDLTVGEYWHDGALAAGESYGRSERILLPPGTSARYKLFVVSDAKGDVFEDYSEVNNVGRLSHGVDVMPIPYADLQVASVVAEGSAASGRPLRVTWEVVNNGIGITNTADWSDNVWLSRNADGSDVVASFGSARHIGQLAVGDRYSRSLDLTLPEGIEGNYYLNVRTGGPFEFVFGDNNTGSSAAVPITLSASPDLAVETVSLPATAQEGALIDVSWTVVNQGEAAATGLWVDTVWLVPVDGSGSAISLGSFTYDRGLESGIRYTRTEQVRLPAKIEGLYRVQVITNANLGASGSQMYEHGAARTNNTLISAESTEVSMLDRADLRVGAISLPEHVTAGTAAGIRYTISNMGALATSGRWTDKVYLSLDATLSGDDRLVGQFQNGAALAPSEAYANETAMVEIPIRYRGDAYLIVVADGNHNIDEYPNEANNVRAAHFYIDPVPFGDLVTSDIVAPDQAVHGASIEVRYKVANLGSATTRGDEAALNTWTDTVWLTRDKRRPGAYKGDILLGSFTHVGNLGVGEDYLGTAQVAIPDNVLSGQYHITVWSDTYDVLLEDTLASNINLDDATQVDNNNYKARPISVLGITPPDLVVSDVVAPDTAEAGGSYTFGYTVQNRGDVFEGSWTDSVYITDNPDWSAAREVWKLGDYQQTRTLGNGERYSVSQTIQLAPSVKGRYIVVRSDTANRIGESDEGNNNRAASSVVTTQPADLQVTDIRTEPANFSGEQTTITWTVTNFGGAVWAGTRSWVDAVYLSRDPNFIPDRATPLGTFVHANVDGLASGGSYTTSAKVRLPAGIDGPYYLYVITDDENNVASSGKGRAKRELLSGGDNTDAKDFHTGGDMPGTAYEGARNDNNIARGNLEITYREPDLQVDTIAVSDPSPHSGQTVTVTWAVSNRGTRETRINSWYDGVYLSRDGSLDYGDYPLVDRGSQVEALVKAKNISFSEDAKSKYLKPGESYTASATFKLPESISGDFRIIVRTDTPLFKDPWGQERSTIRDGLPGLARLGDPSGAVPEFQDEGNNVTAIDLPITLATPPDLQVTAVTAPASVLAGQTFTVSYQVVNSGGDTPSDQTIWNDLVYLSKDRFLDVNQDRYLGYIQHKGALAGGAGYDASLTVTVPKNLEGAYYLFVVTDPARAWGTGEYGKVREFGKEQNNATAADQPILVEVPPPADLKVTNVVLPSSAKVGDEVRIDYTITNDSINTAYGRWTDALYLSADNAWDLGDILTGKVEHVGDLAGGSSYSGVLTAKLPPLKNGNWRIIVRPDLYNEVFEGTITYTATGLSLPPGEANNRIASGATMQVTVPELQVASPLDTTLSPGEARLYRVSVAAGETLQVSLDAAAAEGSNELYLRYGDIPTGYAFDAAYGNPAATDQQAVIGSTRAGDYYILVRARQGAADSSVTLRADLLPLSITRITPDQGGTGDEDHRWVTLDIYGAHFKAGALVKLSRPGVFEAEPERWQVLDATHIRAIFDLRKLPHGLYDVTVLNPDGQRVTEAQRYLVERGIEADITIGIGGARSLNPGENALYSVSLQSLTNVDTPYVRFDFGAPEMGYSANVLGGLNLPYVVFGSNVAGQPDGRTVDAAGNTQHYGVTPSDGTPRSDIPWARLDGVQDTFGFNLAPGYAFDVPAGGFVGMSFNVQTYPGLAEWLAYDFEGLRDKLYAVRPDWKAQGLLDGGVQDLDKIAEGLATKFQSKDPEVHVTKLENLAMPFRFNVVGAATPLTRDEFVADQSAHAKKLRSAILADTTAPSALATLAADEGQWVSGWLGALEAAGLLRPLDEAPPIRDNPEVLSLNATLATGILLGKGGDSYRTQADILGFFAKVQAWYGDTAKYAGDPDAAKAMIDYIEVREDGEGGSVEIPVPVMAEPEAFELNASHDTHFINFNIFAGSRTELEYLRHIGVLDQEFNPVAGQTLNLTQYLQQAAQQNVAANALVSVRGPQAVLGDDGNSYVPADTALPYTVSFSNPTETPAGQLRIVTQLDANLDPRSLRLGDLKIGDINVHLPTDKANFQGDFDFTASKGFVLRISAGVDASTGVATWLLQAIDPDTGEVMPDATQGLLARSADASQTDAEQQKRGFVSYTIRSADTVVSGAEITASARILLDAAPPIDSDVISVKLDAKAPQTTLKVTSLGNDAQGAPMFDVQWRATDDASGIKSVTVYVAEEGGDFKIWQRQVGPDITQAMFTGVAGKHYEFLAVATDKAGNREAASVANAVLPDDGARQDVLDALGVNETVTQTAETPLAPADRSYAANALFEQSTQQLPGRVATYQTSDLRSVLSPFTLRGFADGYAASDADIGAQALVELPDHSILVSAGAQRNEVYRHDKKGGHSTMPLFTLDAPVLDMAIDAVGQLWVMTGAELLQVDANSGAILQRLKGPGADPLTHALAIHPQTGEIYVSSGKGIEIFNPAETNPAKAWKHFSNQRVGDLAFGPDGRLWGVKWTGTSIVGAALDATTDIVSFPMSGRTAGRAELEYRLSGLVDSISFGVAGTPLEGLLVASTNLKQRPVVDGAGETPHQSVVWMIELASRRVLQVATGGTRGESIVATTDGRILVAETGRIDEVAPRRAPTVQAVTVPDGALMPLPMNRIGVVFDMAMWVGNADDVGSVLNPANYSLTVLGTNGGAVVNPESVTWDAATRTAWLDVAGLEAGQYQLEIQSRLESSAEVPLEQAYISTFTALNDMSAQLRLDFTRTRADRATGTVSYDVSVTNIGVDDLKGPMMLLLDPGRYFGGEVDGANASGGEQSGLWVLDLTTTLQGLGGSLAVGATLADQTVTIVPLSLFAPKAGLADLAKANLGHGVYAYPQDNLPPQLTVVGVADTANAAAYELPPAMVGQAWSADIEAIDYDGTLFYWQLVQAPAGVTLTPSGEVTSEADGYHNRATLVWTPTANADAATEILVRVQDSRGGIAYRHYQIAVAGGNHAPVVSSQGDITLKEGEILSLPIAAADADGDTLTVTVKNLPSGAIFDASTGLLSWVPGYDQAGIYENVTVIASDGKRIVSQRFNLTVEQAYPAPVLQAVAQQTLREGDKFALQLSGSVPGGLTQADGTTASLEYACPWLPGGATLNSETGWFEWTPSFAQHGSYKVPVLLIATWTAPDGEVTTTTVTREIVLDVINANGAPIFDAAETWQVLEGQPLRISVFAFDPDNPSFEPKVRFNPAAPASGPETTAPTVSYEVSGLPEGASFDAETMEIVWTPGYAQAGIYSVTVTATDEGDGTGTPAISHLTLPIVVTNANRAPMVGDIQNAFVDKGGVLEIPINAVDVDGNPVELTFSGLPRFATYTQNPSADPSKPSGVLHFAPGAGDRGDYIITVTARDDGDGDINQVLAEAKSFVLTVKSTSEAPIIVAPKQVVALAGQPLSVALLASDLDQDALTWSTDGLPSGAKLVLQPQYGQAALEWTPELTASGVYDVTIAVTDKGLPPQDAGYTNPENPVPSMAWHNLRIVVRDANEAPGVLGIEVNGQQVADPGHTDVLGIAASEGVPLTLNLYGFDADADRLDWKVTNLPQGMVFTPSVDGAKVSLGWTPGNFAAQDGNTGMPGLWRFTVAASDGAASFTRTVEVRVVNVNQTPRILPMPLQLGYEGETVAFAVRAADADNDALQLSLVYDDDTPAGVSFDATTGYFEWTPDQGVVDNALASDKAFTFTFKATDGTDTTTQTVQLRVFDVNRIPELSATNHAVVIGDTLSIPVSFGDSVASGILASDPDGAALTISFFNLPEGAVYDAQAKRLIWTPGPGQIGDSVITATVSDGRNTRSETFVLRVVADAAANAPKILVSTTPSTPALPGQTVIATVRADAWSGVANLTVEMRDGEGGTWQPIPLDAAGRLRLIPAHPGLIELRVTATDRDGFVSTKTHTIRVKDPADTTAPQLAWTGAFAGATAHSEPRTIADLTGFTAQVTEAQLMGWHLQIAPAGTDTWRTLAEADAAAVGIDQMLALASLDPQLFRNGVYQLRLTAWDLAGRTSGVEAAIVVDSATKAISTQTQSDARVSLAGHELALTRQWAEGSQGDLGNWSLQLYNTQLTGDQPATLPSGAAAPWSEGARVWLTVPADPGNPQAGVMNLRFTLGSVSERLGSEPGAPVIWRPQFTADQGWQLLAHGGDSEGSDASHTTELLTRQGDRFYNQVTGLPWVPTGYTLTAPDGTRYELDAAGSIGRVSFIDGQAWLVTDSGIAAVGSSERVSFERDSSGRIVRVTYPNVAGAPTAIAYRYDDQGRLMLVRHLDDAGLGTPIAYTVAGQPVTDPLTANLGAVVNWSTGNTNAWSGTLTADQTATFAFAVRESEIASTVHAPGGQGAVILALEALLPSNAHLEVAGAQIIGTAIVDGKVTHLLRVTESGVKLIRISGEGEAQIRISLAGDLNRDGKIDGADSALWEQASVDKDPVGDLTGDGLINVADRQTLYANTGFAANRAPMATDTLPSLKTHTDLGMKAALASIAEDLEGDAVFWRVLGSTHGTARLDADGKTASFTPEAGYSGEATIRLQADDGFAAGAPIELKVNVSGAKLVRLHLAQIPALATGQFALLQATADFEDEQGVAITNGDYLTVSTADLAGMGHVGASPVQVDDAHDLVRAMTSGPALVIVRHLDSDGHFVQAAAALNIQVAPLDPDTADEEGGYAVPALAIQPDVYPDTLSLVPGGTRQLKVHLLDPNSAEQADIHAASQVVFAGAPEQVETYLDPSTQLPLLDPDTGEVMLDPDTGEILLDPNTGETITYVIPAVPEARSGTRYLVSDESVATVSEDGLITARKAGRVTLSIVHLATASDDFGWITEQVIGQTDITLTVEAAQLIDNDPDTAIPVRIAIDAAQGGVVQAETGETVMIGAGALKSDVPVGIERIDISDIEAATDMTVPAAGVLQTVGAFRLDIGEQAAGHPLQLSIPLQGTADFVVGEEVLFFKKGVVLQPDGSFKDTWWLVDNGTIGTDGVARTASPPYNGLDASGEYVVSKRIPGVIAGSLDLVGSAGDWITFGGMGVSLGFGMDVAIHSEMLGIIASAATSASAGSYHFGVPQFVDIPLPQIAPGDRYELNLPDMLPPAQTPWGSVVIPNIATANVDDSGAFKITLNNPDPGPFAGKLTLRMIFANGATQDVLELPGTASGEITVTPPAGIAIGSVRWQVVRLIPTSQLNGSGSFTDGRPLEFAGNVLRIEPKPHMAAVLARSGVEFVRQSDNAVVGTVNLLDHLGSNDLDGSYLTGGKVQPVVFTDDLSTVYVAGNGVIYAIDMLNYKLIDKIAIPAGKNISSLVTVGSLLIIGEGERFGGGGGNRLLVMDIDPGSPRFKEVMSLKSTGVESAPYGVGGMTVGPDGKTLVVSAPRNPNSVSLGDPNKRGDILVLDLSTLNLKTGAIAAPIIAQLPSDGISGKAPQVIAATRDADRYLVSNVADYNRGLSTLVLARDANGKVTAAKMVAIPMSQPGNAIRIDRLDIQRAQSAVLVEVDNVEYAIVSDDNYHFLDPYWKAMYEAPMFIQTSPFGPPTAVGGSASAKKVNVGGKLGIVKDPFGKPEFIGATLPLDGYGILNLSVSEDKWLYKINSIFFAVTRQHLEHMAGE